MGTWLLLVLPTLLILALGAWFVVRSLREESYDTWDPEDEDNLR